MTTRVGIRFKFRPLPIFYPLIQIEVKQESKQTEQPTCPVPQQPGLHPVHEHHKRSRAFIQRSSSTTSTTTATSLQENLISSAGFCWFLLVSFSQSPHEDERGRHNELVSQTGARSK